MAMVMDGAADSVVNEMYKLEYENPDNAMVKNTLGWVLLHARKAEQALSVYEKLTDSKTANGDFAVTLNAFYACLANGKAEQGWRCSGNTVTVLTPDSARRSPICLPTRWRRTRICLKYTAYAVRRRALYCRSLLF